MIQQITLLQIKEIITNATIIITDSNIYKLYADIFKELDKISNSNKIIVIDANNAKNKDTLFEVIDKILMLKIGKSDNILAIGGGNITDLAGFVGAIYLRGIEVNFVPTTLLAMVDASIGGKNGIDMNGVKNLLGTFCMPKNIYICLDFLNTLDKTIFMSGIAEILKVGFLFDNDLIGKVTNFLNIHFLDFKDKINNTKISLLNSIVNTSISLKQKVVEQDPLDKNARHCLNFGHTLGHIIETEHNLQHGIAVAYGMIEETKLAAKLELTYISTFDKVREIINSYYPVRDFDLPNLYNKLVFDKKIESSKIITIPVVKTIGRYELIDIELNKILPYFN